MGGGVVPSLLLLKCFFLSYTEKEEKISLSSKCTQIRQPLGTLYETVPFSSRNRTCTCHWTVITFWFSQTNTLVIIPTFTLHTLAQSLSALHIKLFSALPVTKKSSCFVTGVAQSASSRFNVGVKCTHRLELALW